MRGSLGAIPPYRWAREVPDLQNQSVGDTLCRLRIIRDEGLTPGSDDGSLAFGTLPHFLPKRGRKSPKIPQKRENGFLRRKCYDVLNLRKLWKKTCFLSVFRMLRRQPPPPPFFLFSLFQSFMTGFFVLNPFVAESQ